MGGLAASKYGGEDSQARAFDEFLFSSL